MIATYKITSGLYDTPLAQKMTISQLLILDLFTCGTLYHPWLRAQSTIT